MIRLLRYILLINIALNSCCAFAMVNESLPIKINSDQVTFDSKRGVATYVGNVTVKQGTRDLRAHKLTIHRDKQNKIEVMIATGNPAMFSSQEGSEKDGFGQAKIIKYYPQANKVDLFDDASLTQNGDTISGPKLTYNFETEELQSKSSTEERTTVILQPKRVNDARSNN